MASEHTPADDIVYDLISVQYHALKSGATYDTYIDDAHEHDDVADFLRQCREHDAARAERCHHLIGGLIKATGGIG